MAPRPSFPTAAVVAAGETWASEKYVCSGVVRCLILLAVECMPHSLQYSCYFACKQRCLSGRD